MQRIVFYIIYPFIWLISKAPFPILYVFSDFIFLIVYYLIGYRKKLVLKNLQLVFPDKSITELKAIRKSFYHHFVDIFMEMIKTFTISEKDLALHYKFKNLSVITDLAKKNKSIILIGSHYANWEWAAQLSLFITHEFVVTYTKVQNKIFNKKIKDSRERFGGKMVMKSETMNTMNFNAKHSVLSLYALLSDQSPQLRKTFYWNTFLGVEVPIHTGAEMLAKKHDFAVVYVEVEKYKRGYYVASFELITEHPRTYDDYKITDIFLEKLEKQIRKEPSYYFWTHNRFKHSGNKQKSRLKR